MSGIRNFFLSLVAALAPASVWAAEPPPPGESYGCGPSTMWGGSGPGMMWSGGWADMIFGPLLIILVFAVVIASVVLLMRRTGTPWHDAAPTHFPHPGFTPVEILKERFACGEIDKDEFEEYRRLLVD